VVINRTMAEKYWPGENPVDRRIQLFGSQGPWFTITGVVGDVRQIAPETPAREEMYISHRRSPGQEMSLVVRTTSDPMGASGAVLQAIHAVDSEQPVFGVMSMEQLQADASAPRRFSLLLLSLFATMALLLSAIGIYGVMAHTTTQRRQEIGIRMALGAVAADVFTLVVGQGMRLVALGLGIGLVVAWGLSRVLQGQLYEITPRDPVTYLAAAGVLGLVALAASYLPARRATRVHPTESMRRE
jgi:predicted lysophospholipase L1 biosynthesis ABC-type transport system permease subunit